MSHTIREALDLLLESKPTEASDILLERSQSFLKILLENRVKSLQTNKYSSLFEGVVWHKNGDAEVHSYGDHVGTITPEEGGRYRLRSYSHHTAWDQSTHETKRDAEDAAHHLINAHARGEAALEEECGQCSEKDKTKDSEEYNIDGSSLDEKNSGGAADEPEDADQDINVKESAEVGQLLRTNDPIHDPLVHVYHPKGSYMGHMALSHVVKIGSKEHNDAVYNIHHHNKHIFSTGHIVTSGHGGTETENEDVSSPGIQSQNHFDESVTGTGFKAHPIPQVRHQGPTSALTTPKEKIGSEHPGFTTRQVGHGKYTVHHDSSGHYVGHISTQDYHHSALGGHHRASAEVAAHHIPTNKTTFHSTIKGAEKHLVDTHRAHMKAEREKPTAPSPEKKAAPAPKPQISSGPKAHFQGTWSPMKTEGLEEAHEPGTTAKKATPKHLPATQNHNFNTRQIGRAKLIRVRIRNGVVQRQKKLSDTKGYREHKGQIVRMSNQERLHRRLGARKARLKRRAHRAQSRIKLLRSLRKRRNMGL